MEGRTTITSLHLDGEPKSPKGVKTIVVNQCRCYVREHIPISFKLWKKTKRIVNESEIIPDTEKEMLWADVKRHFSFSEDKEELFDDWVMKKMAIAFHTFKKNLNKDFIKKSLMPDFEKHFQKQHPYWELGCIRVVQIVRGHREKDSTSQSKHERKEALSSSWARRLFVGDPEMEENGRRPHCKGNRTGDFQLAAVSEVFLLRSWRLPKLGRWITYY